MLLQNTNPYHCTARLIIPTLFLLPHLHKRCQILIPRPLSLHELQRLAQELLHAHVPPLAQEILHGTGELGIDIARERMARVIDEDAHQHDGIVMDIPGGRDGVAQRLANAMSGLLGCIGTGFGVFDNGREMDKFGTLLLKRGIIQLVTSDIYSRLRVPLIG